MQLYLSATASVTLDGSGDGTAAVGPRSFRESWSGVVAAVKASSNVKEATCRIYAGADSSQANFADGTTWGSTGDSSSNIPDIKSGGQVFAVWSGGDAGARATITVTGTRTVQ